MLDLAQLFSVIFNAIYTQTRMYKSKEQNSRSKIISSEREWNGGRALAIS